MIVDILNTDLRGGAAVAAIRQHSALLANGIDSRLWYSPKTRYQTTVQNAAPLRWPQPWFKYIRGKARVKSAKRRYISGRPSGFEVFTQPNQPTETPFVREQLAGDVLHLHWISRWIDQPSFFETIPGRSPDRLDSTRHESVYRRLPSR